MIEHKADPERGRGGRHHGGHRGWQYVAAGSDIRQIVVHVDDSEAGGARLDLACHLAKAFEAEIVGVACLPPEAAMSLGTATAAIRGFSVMRDAHAPSVLYKDETASSGDLMTWQRQVHATERLFRDQTTKAHIRTADWRVIDYGGLKEMLGYAKTADLTILGQRPSSSLRFFPGFAPDDVTLASGRPTLVVPLNPDYKRIGQVVAIAWDGSREAVRAVHDGMPLLRDAARIVILEVDRAGSDPESPPADALQALLGRHGFQAFAQSRSAAGGGTGAALEEAVIDLGADLLIAGLYHHSRIREGLFGGVSRDLLRRMPIPVLVSH